MADDLSNILHSNFGLRPSGKSAPMGAKKAVSPGSSGPGYSGRPKSGGQANTDPIQDDMWGNGAGSKATGSFGNSYEAFGSTGGASYSAGEDPFFSGPPSANAQTFPADNVFGMGSGSGSGRSAGGGLDDPFVGGSFGSSPTAPDPFGGLGGVSSMPRGSPIQQTSSGRFQADDDLLGGFGSTMPPRPSVPVSAPDPFTAPPPPVSSKSRGWGTPKESPDPSPRRTFFSSSKQSSAPAENKGRSPMPEPAVPAREEKYLTVGELLLRLSTPPSMSAPPSRPPPPPPGRGRPTPVSTPKVSRQEASRDPPPPPSYTAATQSPSGWQTPTGSSWRPEQPRPEPAAAPENLDGFDDFAASRSRRGTDAKTPEAESTNTEDAEATAAAAAATTSAQQMADAMARAQEKAARVKAAREREEARRAREEAAERLRAETQAKTQRPPDPPPAAAAAAPGFDFFGGSGSRAHSEPRQRPQQAGAQPDFMSVPKPSGPTNLDDLGGMGTRKPPPPDVKKSPSANNVTDWTDVLGGVGVHVPSSSDFQEIDGEAPERRELRHQRYLEVQRRATEALAEKNRRDMEAQQDQVDRARAEDVVGHEIKRWASGKENNIRALLSTLQFVLWPEAGWEPIGLTDLMSVAAVKKAYRKATLCVHPDKVQQKGATATQKYIAEKVFDLLKEAWNKCNQSELF